jgi:hypothetical protein
MKDNELTKREEGAFPSFMRDSCEYNCESSPASCVDVG